MVSVNLIIKSVNRAYVLNIRDKSVRIVEADYFLEFAACAIINVTSNDLKDNYKNPCKIAQVQGGH